MAKLRVSLANKCQILFGAAVVLILGAALAVPWMRMQKLVDEGQREIARKLADAWLEDLIQLGGALRPVMPETDDEPFERPLRLTLLDRDEVELEMALDQLDTFLAESWERFDARADTREDFLVLRDEVGPLRYRYVRAIRQSDLEGARGGYASGLPPTQVADPLRAMLLIEFGAEWAGHQLLLNRIYIAIAGLTAGLLAIAVFWFITTRIILSPVRVLRETAEKVAEGDLNIRADINTGDEFEQLSGTFNTMLATIKDSQDRFRTLNRQLDLKVDELANANLSLFEANRLKGDFLANVSHELRTPLHSIIGFSEILEGMHDKTDPASVEKRGRYTENIMRSSRSLLELINELLDLAKIEAGRVDLHVEQMSVSDACEALVGVMTPQAELKGVELLLRTPEPLPIIRTDQGKFQQIIFNFLSNAVKFTPKGGRVVLGAVPETGDHGDPVGVRVWVQDTGPGIASEFHEAIFDKFRQLDAAHTKAHGGTGLGLAISRELAKLLQARIELDSEAGRGATFSLIIPMNLTSKTEPLMPDRAT